MKFFIVRALNMSGGPYVIRQVTGDSAALSVTGCELKRCEEELIEFSDFTLGLPEQPTDTEDDEESQEESLLTPGWLDLRPQNVDVRRSERIKSRRN